MLWHCVHMREDYYSTQPFLAWCFNHYFFGRLHFAYVGAPFHPYRLANPRSSDPWDLYGSMYKPWVDRDPYDSLLEQKRRRMRAGLRHHRARTTIRSRIALGRICARVDSVFFLPVVYRVDVGRLPHHRLTRAGSGGTGSNEWLIQDLAETEFDILYFDAESDPHIADADLIKLGGPLLGLAGSLTPDEALSVLWRRLV